MRGSRVVTDTDILMLASRCKSSLVRVVFPAPDSPVNQMMTGLRFFYYSGRPYSQRVFNYPVPPYNDQRMPPFWRRTVLPGHGPDLPDLDAVAAAVSLGGVGSRARTHRPGCLGGAR